MGHSDAVSADEEALVALRLPPYRRGVYSGLWLWLRDHPKADRAVDEPSVLPQFVDDPPANHEGKGYDGDEGPPSSWAGICSRGVW